MTAPSALVGRWVRVQPAGHRHYVYAAKDDEVTMSCGRVIKVDRVSAAKPSGGKPCGSCSFSAP